METEWLQRQQLGDGSVSWLLIRCDSYTVYRSPASQNNICTPVGNLQRSDLKSHKGVVQLEKTFGVQQLRAQNPHSNLQARHRMAQVSVDAAHNNYRP